MSEWKVENIATLANGKKAKDISPAALYPIYGGNGIMGYTNSYNASNVVIIGRVGAYCGSVHYSKEKCWISDNAISAMVKDNNSTEYLYYLLTSLHLNRHHIGGAQPLMTQGIINNIDIPKHSNSEQKKIADILSSLDEKIETNRKINARLEELAQAIFKSWFIDFEPFGGKMPEDWTECKLEDLLTVRYGKDHKYLADGIFPVYGSGGIMRYAEKYLYDKESVLIPRKGSLNNIYYIDDSFWTVDTMFFTEMKKDNLAKYIYFCLKELDFESMNCGSAIPSMSTSILNPLKVILPSDSALAKFEETINPLFIKVKDLQKESARIAELRDTLLPKLMSGELIPE